MQTFDPMLMMVMVMAMILVMVMMMLVMITMAAPRQNPLRGRIHTADGHFDGDDVDDGDGDVDDDNDGRFADNRRHRHNVRSHNVRSRVCILVGGSFYYFGKCSRTLI